MKIMYCLCVKFEKLLSFLRLLEVLCSIRHFSAGLARDDLQCYIIHFKDRLLSTKIRPSVRSEDQPCPSRYA